MRFVKEALFLVLFFVCISFVCANTIYVSPSTVSVSRGDSFEILVNASTSTSDIYAVQFDLIYDSSILTLDSVSEGEFFSSDGATTIFNYSSFGSGVADNVLNVRNETYESSTPGITGDGSVAVFSFTASTAGTSAITLSNVLWMNSTIKNFSYSEVEFSIENASIIVSVVQSSSSSSGSSSSGGGGGGTTQVVVNISNSTNESINSGEINFEIQEDGKDFVEQENKTDELNKSSESRGFLSFTGRVIDDFFSEGKFLSSFAFWFIVGLVIIFLGIIITRKMYLTKHKKFNKAWFPRKN